MAKGNTGGIRKRKRKGGFQLRKRAYLAAGSVDAAFLGHAPLCGALEAMPDGRTWEDMPGSIVDDKKLNFFFYRRGMRPDIEADLNEEN